MSNSVLTVRRLSTLMEHPNNINPVSNTLIFWIYTPESEVEDVRNGAPMSMSTL